MQLLTRTMVAITPGQTAKMNKGENKFFLDSMSSGLISTRLEVSPFLWKETYQFFICDRASPLILPLYTHISSFIF